jgi:hypothetical protein
MKIIKLSIIISILIVLGFVINYHDMTVPIVSVEQPISTNVESSYPAPIPTILPYPYPNPVVTPCPIPVCTVFYDANGNRYGTCYQTCFEP